MEQWLVDGVSSSKRGIDLLAMAIIPLEAFCLMVYKRRLLGNELLVNASCAACIWLLHRYLPLAYPHQIIGFFRDHALFKIELNSGWVLAHILMGDFCFYVWHRLAHTKYIFQVEHSVHHSSEQLDFSTNLRLSFFVAFYGWFSLIIPAFLGFHMGLMFACFALANAVPFFLHNTYIKKLGWLEYIFNTPSHHRVHHGKNPQYINKNFGGMFILWDRLLGTFAKEDEPVKFGVAGMPSSHNPAIVLFQGWWQLGQQIKANLRRRPATQRG